MLTHFPIRYDDELFYSVASRYSIRSGNNSHRATLSDLFGSSNYSVSIDLQSGISRIISNLPLGTTVTEEQLIFQSTLYLFYTAFRNEEQRHRIWDDMISENGRDLYNAIGQSTSPIKVATHFQYCPKCNSNAQEKYGEFYWRRLFQVPGVKICAEHGGWLNLSNVARRGHNFTIPTQENCPEVDLREVLDATLLSQYRRIVNDIEQILNRQYPNRSLEWFYKCYKSQLMRKGYTTAKGRVEQKRLRKDFIDYFGIEFLDILQSSVVGEANWLRSMFQKHKKGKEFHPIRHLLVIQFLGLSLDDVFYADESQFLIYHELSVDRPKRKIMKKTMTPEYKSLAKKERREAWTEMRKQHPQMGRLELRKINNSVYSWLYLYDREFLMENMPVRLPPKSVTVRYDWRKRDETIHQSVQVIVEKLLADEGKPRRISIAIIHEMLGEKCLYGKHLKKMPITRDYLEGVLDSTERFRERVILWAIQELRKVNEPLILNRIKLKAGVGGVSEFMLKHPEVLQ